MFSIDGYDLTSLPCRNLLIWKRSPIPASARPSFHGVLDRNLKKLEARLGVSLAIRGDQLLIDGDPERVAFALAYFDKIRELDDKGRDLKEEDFLIALDLLEEGSPARAGPSRIMRLPSRSTSPGSRSTRRASTSRTTSRSIKTHDLVFGIGPAGTGKTYLAMAMALSFLQNKLVERIILTRPAVEAGEKLGFLPGDIAQKVNPYLRPLYDALFDLSQYEQANRLIEQGHHRDRPPGLHERPDAQQRLHHPGRGPEHDPRADEDDPDPAGVRLEARRDRRHHPDRPAPSRSKSGVLHAMKILAPLKEIAFIQFSERDVVRHPLVQKIIKAYQKAETRTA